MNACVEPGKYFGFLNSVEFIISINLLGIYLKKESLETDILSLKKLFWGLCKSNPVLIHDIFENEYISMQTNN
ncbi:MAG: hypothetical protein A2Y62_03975 [Candidatus Fischerbacteria bacterium RBG_13_37_8]|uniref:Uncharacterized protein n=1 Tax=Candidatus Fischerbacteria bacterium RBG_13_37_8 TaxID=1817863 RepID=A0A1F5V6X8_9BACT|nr:MAG: hypothetical protein A2Y62_03975 [Candidatus Fischerbacteria bacterium RBG_13_37_8]